MLGTSEEFPWSRRDGEGVATKLAEALILRADCQKRIELLRQRIVRNVSVQEGNDPLEDAGRLIAEAERVADDLVSLIQRINRTNTGSQLSDGMTISDALAQRDMLAKRQAIHREAANAASEWTGRWLQSELRMLTSVDVAQLQQRVDDLGEQYRNLDVQIQGANLQVDLVD